jgi:hypothetical protein
MIGEKDPTLSPSMLLFWWVVAERENKKYKNDDRRPNFRVVHNFNVCQLNREMLDEWNVDVYDKCSGMCHCVVARTFYDRKL